MAMRPSKGMVNNNNNNNSNNFTAWNNRSIRTCALRFARRQRTWFRAVEGAVWLHPEDQLGILKRVEGFLAGAGDAA